MLTQRVLRSMLAEADLIMAVDGYPTLADALHGVRGFTISYDRAYASASVRGIGLPCSSRAQSRAPLVQPVLQYPYRRSLISFHPS